MQTTLTEGLVFMSDLSGFGRISKSIELLELSQLLQEFAAISWQHVSSAQGSIIKYLGDSALGFFPSGQSDAGVQALMAMKKDIEIQLKADGTGLKLRIGAHYGPFALTSFPPLNLPDIIGETVNIAATMGSGGQNSHRNRLILSPEAFRSLGPELRKKFHKFTEPIVYLANL
ncbi:MAG: hypothetical protein KKI09_02990 [Spirochaetes bacterium]|nr:hypothetical protein [Spirochaetota bacterium]